MTDVYWWAITGLVIITLTVFIQGLVAAMSHAGKNGAVPGKMSDGLSHESFEFRSHRTFHNSLENLSAFVIPAILAMFVGLNPATLAAIVWVYALVRIIHMVLYYSIATEKNPSPRSYFYLAGWLANAALYGLLLWKLLMVF
ncbi:MAPEG family protein [Salinimonas lutimaris]|uniref:MAPEG family protein n=1 Tax=Salinimonas lutimaris TaxID=914153 RepID=UPI0010C0DCF7|nr:MAPEG family protein [Salinimonas lutimaris]